MGDATPGRRAAAAILRAVSRGRRLDRSLDEAVRSLGERERRWVQEAAYGTVRLRGRLDFLLDLHLTKGISSLAPPVLELLRLGAYQLLYMAGVPPYAALSQTVSQVREVVGEGAARLANGVLRSLSREGGAVDRFPELSRDPRGHLSTWGSHPAWLVERWLARWDPPTVQRLVEWNNEPPPLYLRPLGLSVEEAAGRIAREGMGLMGLAEGAPCLLLERGTNPAFLLERVRGIVQDPGAALVTVYADPPQGAWVADLCAAPGGKALALAGEGHRVVAADRSGPRLRVMRENLDRVGDVGGLVSLVKALAQAPPLAEVPFVLLDVPCTGTGTLRRHPDARWRLTLDTLARLVELQGVILEAGASLVPRGGHLVYSTCTLEPEENEARVDAFLMENPGFALQATDAVESRFLDERGLLRVLPHASGFDGAFAARMVRWS